MAESDSEARAAVLRGRVRVVLVNPSLPANIGAAARAMKTMGLAQLVLVQPRAFPDPDATALASGADDILAQARVVDSLDAALADCVGSFALAAHRRHVPMPEYQPRSAAPVVLAQADIGPVALVFGTERSGLTNTEIERCHALVTIPTVADFSSLNLAQAVQVLCYELHLATLSGVPVSAPEQLPATGDEMEQLYAHYQRVLQLLDFFGSKLPTKLMRRLRRLLQRGSPSSDEVRLLRGILSETERTVGSALQGSSAVADRYRALQIALRLPRAERRGGG